MRKHLIATLVGLTLGFVLAVAPFAEASAPSGDYIQHDSAHYFTKAVNIDGTLTAPAIDCSAVTSWSGSTLNFNASSNFAVNVATGTSTGTVTVGGTGTQTIAVGSGAGAKTVTLGSATGASATTISGGTGDIAITSVDDLTLNGGSAGSLINIGTNVDGNVFHIGDNDTAADTGTIGSALDTWSLAGIAVTVGSTGTSSALTLQSGTGDVTITSTDDFIWNATDDVTISGGSTGSLVNLGTAAFAQTITIGNSTTNTALALTAGAGAAAFDLNGFRVTMPAAQTIGAGGTVAADACGGLKRISSAGVVTTDTTNTFTAPAAANAGCCMDVVNMNAADAITLDNNASFKSAGAADVVLGAYDTVRVCSTGGSGVWLQVAATGNN